eukprot:320342-Rhodomonas_salina.1
MTLFCITGVVTSSKGTAVVQDCVIREHEHGVTAIDAGELISLQQYWTNGETDGRMEEGRVRTVGGRARRDETRRVARQEDRRTGAERARERERQAGIQRGRQRCKEGRRSEGGCAVACASPAMTDHATDRLGDDKSGRLHDGRLDDGRLDDGRLDDGSARLDDDSERNGQGRSFGRQGASWRATTRGPSSRASAASSSETASAIS